MKKLFRRSLPDSSLGLVKLKEYIREKNTIVDTNQNTYTVGSRTEAPRLLLRRLLLAATMLLPHSELAEDLEEAVVDSRCTLYSAADTALRTVHKRAFQ